MKKTVIIVAVVLLLLGSGIFVWALAACGFDFSKLGTAKYETNTYTAEGAFQKIVVDTQETDVEFKRSEDATCRVDCFELEKCKHLITVEEGVLKIVAKDERKWFDHLIFYTKDLKMTVYLPADQYESLAVEIDTGDMILPEGFTFGSIEIKASTGDVDCRATSLGAIRVKTSTGDIKIEKSRGTELALTVSTGDISLTDFHTEGNVSLNVGTGKTKVSDLECRDFSANGSTGRITLKNVIAAEKLSVETSTGDIRLENCDGAEISLKASTGDVTGTIRSPKVFRAQASTGSVRVPDTTSGGRCEITTSTGDIDIRISE